MADTTEKKTYLINIESNLKKYAEEADEARKRVDELTKENLKLKASGTATTAEIEKNNSALRSAQKEYSNAKKNVDLATQANKAQAGSYEQLYRQWQLAQTQLKLMGNAYTINEKGVRVLSQRYIEQSKIVADAKSSLDAFGKGVHDNRLNVGSYSEAIEGALGKMRMMPGALGQAAGGVQRLGMAFKALLANPIVLIITAIVGAIAGLLKAFKSTDKGATEFAARFEQIKAIIDVVRQRIISIAEAIGHVFKGEWKEAGQSIKEAFTGIAAQIKEATRAAYEYKQQMDILEDAESNYISRSSEMRNAIAKLEFTAQDRTKSTEERKKALEEALRLGEQEVIAQRNFAKQRLENEARYLAEKNGLRMEDVIAFTRMTDAEQANASESLKTLRNNNEEKIIEIEKLYAAWIDADTKFFEENKRNMSRLSGFIDEIARDFQRLKDENLKAIQPLVDMVNAEVARMMKVKELKIDELQFNKDIAAENARITEQNVRLSEWETEQYIINQELKRETAINIFASLSDIVGRQTAAGKAFAVAAATIDTYAAAAKTLNDPTIPSTWLRIAMMAAVILRGLANVKQILAVDTSGKLRGAPSTAPSAITSTPMFQQSFAMPAGSTIFTQPQLTQAQLNTIPSQPLLTAADIADALSKMPAPIVTVEDINAKAASKNKIEVRATI